MIQDYSELIAEVSARSGISDVVNRAAQLTGMAENMLSKRLRLAGMETEVELTTSSTGTVALPDDYREMRLVSVSDRTLNRRPLGLIRQGGCGYAVQGKILHSSFKGTAHTCIYYAALPSLEANDTNWLLDDEPEIYLHAVLFQAYTAGNNLEQAQATAGYLGALIDAANNADHLARHAGTRINLGGVP